MPKRDSSKTQKLLQKILEHKRLAIFLLAFALVGVTTLLLTHAATTDPTTSVYRVYNAGSTEHFMTISPSERDSTLGTGFGYEGVIFYAWAGSGDGRIPVWRLYNTTNNFHFYTANEQEKNGLDGQGGWRVEGPAFYAYYGPGDGRQPIYRLVNRGSGDHLYTADNSEKDSAVQKAGYTYEGVAFYAATSPATAAEPPQPPAVVVNTPATPAPAPTPSVSCPTPRPTIRQGDNSDCVKRAQDLLNQLIGAGLTVDGKFGPATKAAVTNYQQAKGLSVDGVVGNQTWASLESGGTNNGTPVGTTGGSTTSNPTTSGGSAAGGETSSKNIGREAGNYQNPSTPTNDPASSVTGGDCANTRIIPGSPNAPCVKLIQAAVHVSQDGIFGDKTAAAVKKFKTDHGTPVCDEPVVDPTVWPSILNIVVVGKGCTPAPNPADTVTYNPSGHADTPTTTDSASKPKTTPVAAKSVPKPSSVFEDGEDERYYISDDGRKSQVCVTLIAKKGDTTSADAGEIKVLAMNDSKGKTLKVAPKAIKFSPSSKQINGQNAVVGCAVLSKEEVTAEGYYRFTRSGYWINVYMK